MARGLRTDVQGLRAVAVLLVALDHAAVGPFHGGYVGVDVFFVISGFLITGLLVAEHAQHGRISLGAFYARRARRILPASTLVLLVTTLAAVVLLSGVDALAAIHDAVWVLFFAANVNFARQGTDYFHADANPSPLQHYWSLSVEEQFYFLWPVLIVAICWVAARTLPDPRSPGHRGGEARAPLLTPVLAALAVVVGASFAYAVQATSTEPVPAYFSFLTRAWELGAGAIGACLVTRVAALPRWLRGAMSWVGLVAVLAAGLTFDETTAFPGYAAALPVAGALLLLLGGLPRPGERPGLVQRWVSVPPLRLVGDWSYSLYLWHWPMIVIAAEVWRPVSGWSGVAVLVTALALSALSYHLVENPFRRARVLAARPRRGLLLYPAALALVLPSLAAAQAQVVAAQQHHGRPITLTSYGQHPGDPEPHFDPDPDVALVEASVLAADNGAEIPARLLPDPITRDFAKPEIGDCDYSVDLDPTTRLCPMGAPDGRRTLVVVGDSHARQWIPALEPIAEEHGYRAYWLVREGCPGADVTPWNDGHVGTTCATFQDWARSVVDRLHPDVTLVASEADPNDGYVDDSGDLVTDPDAVLGMFQDGVTATLRDVAASSGRVVYLNDPPSTTFAGPTCLAKRHATLTRCISAPDPRTAAFIGAARAGADAADAQLVDPAPWLCDGDRCPAVIGSWVARRDKSHLTVEYAEHLQRALGAALHLG